ncbi:MAG: FAD-binding protein [Myxococcales bacterium]|nr:FAD-binding protein [Myxococcota bacterium]MDW8280973.1 FAD-binding protein [Myxococcales bacterium]
MLKVIVCLKQVPDVAEIRFDPQRRTLVREGVPAIVNPFDRPALSLAVRLRQEQGAEVTVVTMGPPQAREALYEALASGCDRAVHLCDRAFAGSDTLATACALAAAIRQNGFDLVLCGKHTVDGETAQVGPELAELLGVPHVSGVSHLAWQEAGVLVCERQSDDGHETVRVTLPCLLTCAEHLAPPVPVRRPQLEAARQREVVQQSAADLGLSEQDTGESGSPTWVAEIRSLPPTARPPLRLLRGDPREVAHELARAIREAQAQRPPPVLPPLPPPAQGAKGPPVLVPIERSPQGGLRPGTVELLGAAADLARRLQGEAVAVALGGCDDSTAAACAAAGADVVLLVEHAELARYSSEAYAAALEIVITRLQPAAVLFSSTELGRDWAPRLAARMRLGLTGDAIGLDLDEEQRLVMLKPAFAGHFVAPILSRTRPAMATVRPGAIPARAQDSTRRARTVQLQLPDLPPPRTQLLEQKITVDERAERLLGAHTVVGVGYGVGDPAHLPLLWQLADGLGGALCATRRVTDKGWLPRQLQVGLTGKVIAPHLYLAVGIRGAPNHVVGIQRAAVIMAINTDEKAPIFQLASVGAVGDFRDIVPQLVQQLRSAE